MTVNKFAPEDKQSAREVIYDRGTRAQQLLANPLIVEFFKSQRNDSIEAFESLPLGAGLDQYRTVHFHFIAIRSLKQRLEMYVNAMQNELTKETIERESKGNTNI